MLTTQVSVFSYTGFIDSASVILAPQNLLLFVVFFVSAFPAWFLAYATLGRLALSYSISSGNLSLGSWSSAIILAGIAIAAALNLNSQYQTMFSGPLMPGFLILSASVGFIVFWNKADPEDQQLKARLQKRGLMGKNEEPADWAVAAARRIAEKDT